MEHTAMVELLLDLGITSDIAMACALWGAEKKGLESMADLLRSRGASLAPWIHPPTPWVPLATTAWLSITNLRPESIRVTESTDKEDGSL